MTNNIFLIAQAAPVTGQTTAGKPAQTQTTQTAQADPKASQNQGPMGALGPLPFILIMIAVFYFLMIRPQQKKEKQRKEMLKSLNKGDKVVTRGGIWGVVVAVKPEGGVAQIKIAPDVKIDVSINAIEVVNPSAADVAKA